MTDAMQDYDANTGAMMSLSDKQKETLADYIGDMVALQDHIEEALDSQKNSVKDNATASAAVQRFHDMVKRNRDQIRAYKDRFGTRPQTTVKAAGSALLGMAAGLIDKVRTEGVSKNLRDDYTAFNLAAISYTMLETTALSFGDQQTADLARQGLRDYARAVQEINRIIPEIVIWELQKDDHTVAGGVADQVRQSSDEIWKQTSNTSSMPA